MSLTPDLSAINDEIRGYAREYGLDFYETIFEMIEYDELNEIASLGGFPTRYPHWRFGMEYEELAKSYSYGLSKIYEMVINNDPCYAYLMRCNNLVDQKLVMAHVYGHCDFFKNNLWFSKTNRKMMDEMANHATRVRRYVEQYGEDRVEDFIDVCLTIENLVDPHLPFRGQ
ncbi:SpoVR family protein, partial [candidate division KSB1 bacterium]|nr:SpoVR family protein [candidate division KSB1 bacterium]